MSLYYSGDGITLYHGNCLEVGAWLDADILCTDPPYGMAFRSNQGHEKFEAIAGDETTEIRDDVLLKWGGSRPVLMFGTWKVERPPGVKNVLIWDKTDGSGPGMGDISQAFGSSHEEIYLLGDWPLRDIRRGSVLRTRTSPAALTKLIGHPTPKPTGLMEVLINSAIDGTIADPFAGSGSTLVAARNLGRKAIGVELEERYCEIVAKRLAQGALDFGDAS